MKQLTDKRGWELVKQMGWGPTADYNVIAKEFYAKLGKKGMLYLRMFVNRKRAELYKAVKMFEAAWKQQLDIGSDDGFSDVTYHIVGLGKEEFDKCMANPELIEKRYNAPYQTPEGYAESFAYCFLERFEDRPEDEKADILDAMVTQFASVNQAIQIAETALNDLKAKAMTLSRTISLVKETHKG